MLKDQPAVSYTHTTGCTPSWQNNCVDITPNNTKCFVYKKHASTQLCVLAKIYLQHCN